MVKVLYSKMTTLNQRTSALTTIVLNNLQHQHDWTALHPHTQPNLPRTLLYGLPPKRLYVHPDEQVEIIRAEKEMGNGGERIPQEAELEWVLPLHLSEKWSPAQFAAVFDALDARPPRSREITKEEEERSPWLAYKGSRRGKRVLLATVQDDSTVTYYWMHDGLVKPRQN
ncbi:putative tRNA-splicing endonuclease subunit tsp-1 [Podospora pseudopauciseta]|uniref:tRNA-splicing endonuclease subunit tsp-1 n=2 Tax=Podospora TaxID=5144 RepID=A0ABR0H0N2_9PEZI|nr:putative tRNA-splicing endonuclease subunit tsp-1 [Podospora pseudopauciseta]KAK4668205.1 putative tRNA-splicing endonuclease subunit tsp-1 [Podospora pseudoanserina]